jgi:uncharacterized protein (DUF1330 family)
VILRFPSEADARSWYESPEYEVFARHRHRAATTNAVMVEALPADGSLAAGKS